MNRSDPPGAEPNHAPQPEMEDYLDEKVVTIPCYEPSGHRIDLDGRALCTHSLLLGSTGCGKTSVLRWFIKSLIQHRAQDPAKKSGVFVFDLNGDDTVPLVRKWAAEAGRESDVRLLTPSSGHLDLFANVRSFEDLPSATAQFMHSEWTKDSDNAYWNETTRSLIDSALSVVLAVTGRLETEVVIRFLTNWLVAKRPGKEDEILLKNFDDMGALAADHLNKHVLAKIEHVRANLEMWSKLDPKTRGILASCLLDALGPLISMETQRYLDNSRGACFTPEEIIDGSIMVFCLPAGKYRESASLLGRIIKARLYLTLQERSQNRNQRLCAVVADEYHYLATGGVDRASDVTALATLRSRSVAVIAATQSLDHLAAVMGVHDFRSLVPNFGNHFFFRSTEPTTGALATAVMGTREKQNLPSEALGNILLGLPPAQTLEYVCPPGALAKLEVCQSYVATSTGFRSPGMIWLAGNHENPSAVLMRKEPAPDIDQLVQLRKAALPKPKKTAAKPPPEPSSGPEIHQGELAPAAATLCYDLSVWNRLMDEVRFHRTSYLSFGAFRKALANFGHEPEGLESLPICWWVPIFKLIVRFAKKYPMKLLALHQVNGCLVVLLSGTTADPQTYLNWIATLEQSLYPIRSRRLKLRDERLIAGYIDDGFLLHDLDEDDESQGA